jgi:hypothetical protein
MWADQSGTLSCRAVWSPVSVVSKPWEAGETIPNSIIQTENRGTFPRLVTTPALPCSISSRPSDCRRSQGRDNSALPWQHVTARSWQAWDHQHLHLKFKFYKPNYTEIYIQSVHCWFDGESAKLTGLSATSSARPDKVQSGKPAHATDVRCHVRVHQGPTCHNSCPLRGNVNPEHSPAHSFTLTIPLSL